MVEKACHKKVYNFIKVLAFKYTKSDKCLKFFSI